jgi:hypothetical protein
MTVKDIVAVSDQRHGGPFDRGSADSYYHRGIRPHYYMGATGTSDIVYPEPGTAEYEAYMTGYEYNEQHGDKKDWN